MTAGLADVAYVVKTMARTAVDNETYFGELDAVVGDGDFGYSMARGFEVVLASWDDLDQASMGKLLKAVAVTITGRMGGTSGPIWGTAFLRAGAVAGDRTELGADDVVSMLRAAIEGIKQRGKASLGDKTLLDALVPAVDALAAELAGGATPAAAMLSAAGAAERAAESCRSLVAMRGRAAYAGERSMGALDAGAVAVAVMFKNVAEHWEGRSL
jgi:dihydroxyacetone kinase phosphoprotein-dependent L subunit